MVPGVFRLNSFELKSEACPWQDEVSRLAGFDELPADVEFRVHGKPGASPRIQPVYCYPGSSRYTGRRGERSSPYPRPQPALTAPAPAVTREEYKDYKRGRRAARRPGAAAERAGGSSSHSENENNPSEVARPPPPALRGRAGARGVLRPGSDERVQPQNTCNGVSD